MEKIYFLVVVFLWQFSHSQNSGFFKKTETDEYIKPDNTTENKKSNKRFFKIEMEQEDGEEIIEITNNSITDDQIKFLDSPVENGKITSKYSGRRFHLVTKE